MNNDLVAALNLLRECRTSLVNDFTQKDSDRYYYSFRYGKSRGALDLVMCLTEHQWLDEHFNLASRKFERKEISKSGLTMFLNILKKISTLRSDIQYSSIIPQHNSIKIKALETILSHSAIMENKLKSIEFDYYRDRVLFEREMEKYMNCAD